jgi:hypothetical protein
MDEPPPTDDSALGANNGTDDVDASDIDADGVAKVTTIGGDIIDEPAVIKAGGRGGRGDEITPPEVYPAAPTAAVVGIRNRVSDATTPLREDAASDAVEAGDDGTVESLTSSVGEPGMETCILFSNKPGVLARELGAAVTMDDDGATVAAEYLCIELVRCTLLPPNSRACARGDPFGLC